MKQLTFILFIGLLVGCSRDKSQNEQQSASGAGNLGTTQMTIGEKEISLAKDNKLANRVGQRVTIQGLWECAGKVGPYIKVEDNEIYIVPQDRDSLDPLNTLIHSLSNHRGGLVEMSGILYQHPEIHSTNELISGIPPYYFMQLPGVHISRLSR